MKLATLDCANRWLNDPRILPFHSAEPLDLSPIWRNCVVFEFDTGTVGFYRSGADEWQIHLCLIPGGGARKVRDSIKAMFASGLCARIVGPTTHGNKDVARLARLLGFKPVGSNGAFDEYALDKDQFKERHKWHGLRQ